MNLYRLPPFRPVTQGELRRLWTQYHDPDIRRLLLEVERYRRIISELERTRAAIDRAWKDEVGGQLGALFMLKSLLAEERFRAPSTLDD